ncbi:Histidine acid phosphatase [Phytophthora megakarya]|uniref:Histidine acid phosphatase n=1 Tax=Phytophthora megakarya TaxID=4795 RepID=A0A225X462_9STRA|nr:Histidine acid phosphatase [Phytophthora megakarya]
MAPRLASPSSVAAGYEPVDQKDLTLLHVMVLFRHGDRSPISRKVSAKVAMNQVETEFWVSQLAELSVVGALNSGTKVVNYHNGECKVGCFKQQVETPPPPQQGGRWPCGQLTAKGIDMMRAKGQKLRGKYQLLLQTVDDPVREVYVQSTNIRRTIRSAQSLLAGLFPEYFVHVDADNQLAANEQLLPDSRNFLQHVHKNKKKDDVLLIHADDSNGLAPQHSYELYRDLGKMLAEELKQQAPPGFAETSERISRIIGAKSSKLVSWTGLREVLVCYQAHGLAFPDGLDQQLFAQICEYDAWLWHHLYGNLDFCRVSFRSGVQRIYSYLTGVTQGANKHKMSLFSAHDNSLVAFVNALQLQVPRVIPPYGAMLTFELFQHRVTGAFYLKALFEGVEVTFGSHQHSALCPFAVFQQAAQSFVQVPEAALYRTLTLRHALFFHRHGDRTPVLTSIGTKTTATQEEQDFWASRVATSEQIELLNQTAKAIGTDATQPPVIRPSKESQFPYGLLTQKGVKHMTDKGRTLHQRYAELLNDNVTQQDVYVLSSSVPRTIESVQCLLKGFFEKQKAPQFYVHTYAHNVLAPMHPLQVFNEIELIVHDDVLRLRSKIEREAMDKLGLHLRGCLGVPDDQPLSWTAVRDMLTCREAHGWPFPEGVDQKVFEQVEVYDTWLWQRLYHRKDFCYPAFKDGVKEIYNFVKSVVEKEQKSKISFFSAHDNSIVALLGALQIDVGSQLPEYGTMVTLEIYEDEATHEFFIKPFYEKEEVSFAGHKQDPLCPFSHFESLALEFLSYKAN